MANFLRRNPPSLVMLFIVEHLRASLQGARGISILGCLLWHQISFFFTSIHRGKLRAGRTIWELERKTRIKEGKKRGKRKQEKKERIRKDERKRSKESRRERDKTK